MRYILVLLTFCFQNLLAQPAAPGNKKTDTPDKKILEDIRACIQYLSNDQLEGRRTGSKGEQLAYEYISNAFEKIGLSGLGEHGKFLQPFDVIEGKELKANNHLMIDDVKMDLNKDYYPMPFSPNGQAVLDNAARKIVTISMQALRDSTISNPHFDVEEAIREAIIRAGKDSAKIIFIVDSSPDKTAFNEKDKTATGNTPVFYLTASGSGKFAGIKTPPARISYRIETGVKSKTGHNVIGFIDNKAKNTIILGAHYDHLGYGEDHNSLYSGKTPMIHNGADDNASGTAALIALAGLIKRSPLKNYNYLFIAFSGEELGLFGSKYFAEHPTVDLGSVNYMINMDMVGRLNDSTHGLNIGGYGTSPGWNQLVDTSNTGFRIKLDSSGTGPSDHTSFYRKDIPVLFFFTGTHTDYHKPSDDADKINYAGEMDIIRYIFRLVSDTDKKDKLVFSKTREVSMGKSSFKVTLGIMPDYSFQGEGVRVDGVSEGKAAQKAGIMAGDVLYQLGEYGFTDVQTYMQALNKFNKGEATKVKLKRGKENMELNVVF